MATMTAEQIEQKKQQLKQLSDEMNALVKELQEAGAWPLDDTTNLNVVFIKILLFITNNKDYLKSAKIFSKVVYEAFFLI